MTLADCFLVLPYGTGDSRIWYEFIGILSLNTFIALVILFMHWITSRRSKSNNWFVKFLYGVTDLWTLSGGENSYFIIIWGHIFAVYLYFSAYLINAYYWIDMNTDDQSCGLNVKNSDNLDLTLIGLVIIVTRSFLEWIEIFTALYITDGP